MLFRKCLLAVCLILCTVWAGAVFAVEAFNVKQEFGPVTPKGKASVANNPDGTILISNIGSSGLDGVEMNYGRTRGAIGPIRWMAPESMTGRGLTVIVTGEDSLGNPSAFACSGFGNDLDENQVTFNPMATGCTQVQVTLFRDGNPLYQGTQTLSGNPLFQSTSAPDGVGAGIGGQAYQPFSLGDFTWFYPAGTEVTVPSDSTVFMPDAVRLDFLDRTANIEALTDVQILGTEPDGSVGELMILTFPGTFFGHTIGRLGDSTPSGVGLPGADGTDAIRVEWPAATGEGGVSIARREDDTAVGVALDPLSPAAGSSLVVAGGTAEVDDGSASPLPEITCAFADSVVEVSATSAVVSPPVLVEYLLAGEVVGTAADPAATVSLSAGVAKSSVQAPFKLEIDSVVQGGLRCTLTWGGALQFVDGNGVDQDCDGVRMFFAADPWSAFYRFDNLEIRGHALLANQMTIVGCPNTIGPQNGGISVDSASGVGAASVEMVEGGAMLVRDMRDGALDGVSIIPPNPTPTFGIAAKETLQYHRGHVTVLKAYGSAGGGGGGGGLIGAVHVVDDGSQYLYSVDTTHLGGGNVTYNLYLGGSLVASTICAGTLEECLSAQSEPNSLAAMVGQADGMARMRIGNHPNVVTFIGAKGQASVMADMVEVVIDNPIVTPFTDITDLVWQRSGGGNSLVITDAGASALAAVREVPGAASGMTLYAPSPNPFNPRTVIAFDLEHNAQVSLRIFDLRGQLVRNLFSGFQPAGEFRTIWDGLDRDGRAAASGLYFVQLRSGGTAQTQKAALVR